MTNCGIASGFAFGYDPTRRSVYHITFDHLAFSYLKSWHQHLSS